MALGHWAKSYLSEGKANNGGGSGGDGGSALLVNLAGETQTADKTFGEIEAALNAGRPVYAVENGFYSPIIGCQYVEGEEITGYMAVYFNYRADSFENATTFSHNGGAVANDYPAFGGST